VVNHPTCTNYAQGGARVTNPVGPGNKLLGGNNAVLGQLTVPVATQVARHLTKTGGRFSGREVVQVLAGANDVFMQLASLSAGAAVPPLLPPLL
jgi:outer membrane lipase/esterase